MYSPMSTLNMAPTILLGPSWVGEHICELSLLPTKAQEFPGTLPGLGWLPKKGSQDLLEVHAECGGGRREGEPPP